MNLSIKELNELIYSLGITAHNGNFCNKEVNESLLERLYCELNERIAEEIVDKEVNDVETGKTTESQSFQTKVEISTPYVSNDAADEDYRSAYDAEDYDDHLTKLKERGYITQTLLNYVDLKGAVSHGELETYYKIITGGSNSFSHILGNLRTPYKNRKTQRYIAKEGKQYSDAKYVIKVANPSNWVEK